MKAKEIQLIQEYARNCGFYIPTKSDIPKIIECCNNGFAKRYPLTLWFDQGGNGTNFKEKVQNPKGILSYWQAELLTEFHRSLIIADSPEINACVILLNMEQPYAGYFTWMRNGGIKLLFHMGLNFFLRMISYDKFANKQYKSLYSGALYCHTLVVREEKQHTVFGGSMLKFGLDCATKFKLKVYVDTHRSDLKSLYEKIGMKLISETNIPGTIITHYVLIWDMSGS